MRCILPLVASIVVTTAASPFAADNTFDAETNSKGNPGSIIGATIESSSNEASLDSVSDTDPESILPSESTGVPEVLGVSSVEADETLVTNGNIPATTSTSQSNHISVISDCSDPRVKSPAKRNKRRWWWDSPSLCPVPVPEAPETSEVPAAKPDTPAKKGGLPTQLIPPKQIVPQQDVPSKTEFPFTTPQENPGLCPVILTSPLCCSAIPADYGSFVTDCKICKFISSAPLTTLLFPST